MSLENSECQFLMFLENSEPIFDAIPESHGFAFPPFLEELPDLINFPF